MDEEQDFYPHRPMRNHFRKTGERNTERQDDALQFEDGQLLGMSIEDRRAMMPSLFKRIPFLFRRQSSEPLSSSVLHQQLGSDDEYQKRYLSGLFRRNM